MLTDNVTRTIFALAMLAFAGAANAAVGETHRTTTTPTAAQRNADGSPTLAITVWYPASTNASEQALTIGPPGQPLFITGSAALDAAIAPGRFPVVLLSHGFGGTARMMGWFGTALARAGYVVVAVDHPGSNGRDAITPNGAAWWWERAEDLKQAWKTVQADPVLAPHLDTQRLGVAGFSAGGFAALLASGARVDVRHFVAFCKAHPNDGVCAPQLEAPELAARRADEMFVGPSGKALLEESARDHSLPGVRAAFVMAPALVQALAPDSLGRVKVPVSIVVGTADTVAPAATNADTAAKAIPDARIQHVDGVTHYDFLGDCQAAGRAVVPQCEQASHQTEAHTAAVAKALEVLQIL